MPSPSAVKSPPDSDQNLTIGWNLLSGSVRSETNRRGPRSSERARLARFLLSSCRCDLPLATAREPAGNCYQRQHFLRVPATREIGYHAASTRSHTPVDNVQRGWRRGGASPECQPCASLGRGGITAHC